MRNPSRVVSLGHFLLLFLTFCWSATELCAQTNLDTSQWEKEISAFESSDKTNPPPKGAILFVGSSSFRKWTNITEDFPGKQVINRGFGGSEIADSTALAERIIFPYEPRTIVFYAGDNDLNAGKSVQQVVADYAAFVKKVQTRLPKTRIIFISIKPSIARWRLHDKIVAANDQIKAMNNPNLDFIDVYPLMLGKDGKPKADLFIEDGLHPSARCYHLWAAAIKPYLN